MCQVPRFDPGLFIQIFFFIQILSGEALRQKEINGRIRKINAVVEDKKVTHAGVVEKMNADRSLLETWSSSVRCGNPSTSLMKSPRNELFDIVTGVSGC